MVSLGSKKRGFFLVSHRSETSEAERKMCCKMMLKKTLGSEHFLHAEDV
jgi:hypothetical protein